MCGVHLCLQIHEICVLMFCLSWTRRVVTARVTSNIKIGQRWEAMYSGFLPVPFCRFHAMCRIFACLFSLFGFVVVVDLEFLV